MTTQPDLFDIGERDVHGVKREQSTCTPHPVGSGPDDETCRGCHFATRTSSPGGKGFYKCDLMHKYWTHGGESDIKLRWAACRCWAPLGVLRAVPPSLRLPDDAQDFLAFRDRWLDVGEDSLAALCELAAKMHPEALEALHDA